MDSKIVQERSCLKTIKCEKKIFNKIFRLAINQELLYHLPMQNNGPNHWSKSTTIPMALPPKNLCLELHKRARNAKKKLDAMQLATPQAVATL